MIAFGHRQQQARFLRPILRAEEFWCQGFSEPDAGSDLANIKTTAVLDGDQWLINGQKVWTSLGHIADWIFVVCRTEPPTVRSIDGLTFLLCPMDQPGIDIRPIRQMTGTAEFNEVFFDDARTDGRPGRRRGRRRLADRHGDTRIRARHRVPRPAAAFRRGDTPRSCWPAGDGRSRRPRRPPASGRRLHRLGDHALDGHAHHRPAARRSAARSRVVDRQAALVPMAPAARRARTRCPRRGRDRDRATAPLGDLQYTFQFARAHTIYAGSSEIQRNIIGERVLGLPKEPV